MTAYCTQGDLEGEVRQDEFIQLTDDDVDGVADAAVVAWAIDRASARVDAVAGAHYAVPFTSVSAFVRSLTAALAMLMLAERRGTVPPWVETKRKRVEADLAALAAGTLTVGVQPEPASNAQRTGKAASAKRVFSPDTDWF